MYHLSLFFLIEEKFNVTSHSNKCRYNGNNKDRQKVPSSAQGKLERVKNTETHMLSGGNRETHMNEKSSLQDIVTLNQDGAWRKEIEIELRGQNE